MDEHLHLCPQRDVECGAEHRDCARPFDAWILKKQSGSKTIDSNFMPLVKCALHGNSALNFAVLNGDDELAAEVLRKATQVFGDDEVSMLYAMGAELSHENHAGQTLLTTACFNGYIALVKILVDFGADINGETSRGRTPLGDATLNGSTELVNYLISKRAVVNRVNRFKQTALNLVNRDAHPEVAAILDETSRLEFEQQQLFLAISTSRYDEISRILLGGVRDGYRSGMSFHLQEDFDAQHQAVVDCENLVQEVMVEVNELKRKAKNAKDQMAMLKNQIAEVDSKLASVQTRRQKHQERRDILLSRVQLSFVGLHASDLSKILKIKDPSDATVAVVQSICMLMGVRPRGKASDTPAAWWNAARALFMDRTLLKKLLNYRGMMPHFSTVLDSVRDTCIAGAPDFPELEEIWDPKPKARDRPASAGPVVKRVQGVDPSERWRLVNSSGIKIIDTLGMMVRAVDFEDKAEIVAKQMNNEERLLQKDHDEMVGTLLPREKRNVKIAVRCLPPRVEELELLEQQLVSETDQIAIAERRIWVNKLLAFPAITAHNPLSWAAAYGDQGSVRLLLAHGANSGRPDLELVVSATIIQRIWRHTRTHGTADEGAWARALRGVHFTFQLKALVRARKAATMSYRPAVCEAAYNGHYEIVDEIIGYGSAGISQVTHVKPIGSTPFTLELGSLTPEAHRLREARKRKVGCQMWSMEPLEQPLTVEECVRLAETEKDCMAWRENVGWSSFTRVHETGEHIDEHIAKNLKKAEATRMAKDKVKKMNRQHANRSENDCKIDAAIEGPHFD
jgi:ankyrin repeat protein